MRNLSKPKNKTAPQNRFSGMINFLCWLTVPMLCIAPLVAAVFVGGSYLYKTYIYTLEDIAAICATLSLPPDSAFCKGEGWQTNSQLQEIINQTYPPRATSLGELDARIKTEIRCGGPSGRCVANVPRDDMSLVIFHDGKNVTDYLLQDLREE